MQESLTIGAIGEVQAYSTSTLSAFKALTLPSPLQREVRIEDGIGL